jgi:lipoprotein-anchoring transpeptidase ErfK/SrfK
LAIALGVIGAVLALGLVFVSDQTELVMPEVEQESLPPSEVTEDETEAAVPPATKVLFEYVQIKDSCDIHFAGECVVVRNEPSIDGEVVTQLRNHVILRVDGKVEKDNRTWYKIIFDEYLSYPERVVGDWYVAAEYVDVLWDEGEVTVWENGSTSKDKLIVVDRAKQKLYAYEDGEVFVEMVVSTGLELSPTPGGTFTVFKKMPSRYMQGPLPGFTDYYDLPGVPWNLYFTEGGAVIHGAYWHDSFGQRYSHGCVNLSPEDARVLYEWAELGTKVTVK